MRGLDGGLILIDESRRIECSSCFRPAVWTHHHGCGAVVYACPEHRLRTDIANAPGTPGFLTCNECGHYADQPIQWREL